MTNEEKVRKIWEYQLNDYFHELTCGKENCRCALIPQELDGKVILRCSQFSCDYIQKYIPEFIFDVKNNFESELDYLIKKGKFFPGCFNQNELQKAEILINDSLESENFCFLCDWSGRSSELNKALVNIDVCRFHARYLVFREREE